MLWLKTDKEHHLFPFCTLGQENIKQVFWKEICRELGNKIPSCLLLSHVFSCRAVFCCWCEGQFLNGSKNMPYVCSNICLKASWERVEKSVYLCHRISHQRVAYTAICCQWFYARLISSICWQLCGFQNRVKCRY